MQALHDKLLGSLAHVKSFAGKALSFSLAIPTCKLHVREVLKVTSAVPIQGHLQQDLQEWTFPDKWSGHLPWRSEHYLCHNVQRCLQEGLGSSLDRRLLLSFLIVYSSFLSIKK